MKTENDTRWEQLNDFMDSLKDAEHPESNLINILHKAQALFGYLSSDVMDKISSAIGVPTAHIWGVVTFYHYFNLTPQGKYPIFICLGTACYVKGAEKILNTIKSVLNIDFGETTADGLFTLRETRCLGACGLAPVMMIGDKIYGELTSKKTIEILNRYKKQNKNTQVK